MKRPSRSEDGYYHIDGKKYKELFGSRIQVWNGTAYKTTGELTRSHFMMNKHHRIVSVKKYKTAKKEKRLQKYGYFAEKGKFGYVKRDTKKARKSRKVRGGSSLSGAELSAAYGAGSAAPAAAPAAATPDNAGSSSAPDAGSKN